MNIYREYFETLKSYLEILKIDSIEDNTEKGIFGCSEEEITIIKSGKKKFPIAYEEYLRSIGKKFLFEFMNAENMAYDDLDYINKFAKEVFENNSLKLNNEFIVISERRNEYISLIYSDTDNPEVWIASDCWDEESEGQNLVVRSKSFTDLMTNFFASTLHYKPSGFNFVPDDVENSDIYIGNLYFQWVKGLKEIYLFIHSQQEKVQNNIHLTYLNETFLNYYERNEVDSITFEIDYDDKKMVEDYIKTKDTKNNNNVTINQNNDEFKSLKKIGLIILSLFIIGLFLFILIVL